MVVRVEGGLEGDSAIKLQGQSVEFEDEGEGETSPVALNRNSPALVLGSYSSALLLWSALSVRT